MKNKNTFYVNSEGKFVDYVLVYANLNLEGMARAYWDEDLTNPVSFKDAISLISNICVIDASSSEMYPPRIRPYKFQVISKDDAASLLPDANLNSDLIAMTMIDSNDDTTFKNKYVTIYDEIA